jgi:hypothetical protein
LDFLAGGGGNIFLEKSNFATLDTQDQVLIRYIATESPVNIALQGLILNVNRTSTIQPIGGNGTSTTGGSSTPSSTPSLANVTREIFVAIFGALLICLVIAGVF